MSSELTENSRGNMSENETTEAATEPMTPEQARALLKETERAALQQFVDEYNFLAKRMGLAFVAVPKISNDGRIVATLEIKRVSES